VHYNGVGKKEDEGTKAVPLAEGGSISFIQKPTKGLLQFTNRGFPTFPQKNPNRKKELIRD
jgi:hypothetical protein